MIIAFKYDIDNKLPAHEQAIPKHNLHVRYSLDSGSGD